MSTTTDTSHTSTTATLIGVHVRVGLALSILAGLGHLVLLTPSIEWGTDTPAHGLLVFNAVLGAVGIISALIAWRTGNRVAVWVTVAAMFINATLIVGGFWSDITGFMLFLTAAFITATAVAIVLILLPSYRMTALAD